MRKAILLGAVALCSTAMVGVATSPAALARARAHHRVTVTDPVIYDSTLGPLPGNEPSQAFQATQTSEFGNQVAFGGVARVLDNVVVSMSSWGCQSGSQSVSDVGTIATPTPNSCVTTPGSTFTEPVTLNLYNVGTNNGVGTLIATDTQTFAIPFRPSAVPVGYGPGLTGGCGDGASWYSVAENACYHGLATNITFDFGHVTLPDKVIYGIAYNTSGYGAHPYGYGTACALDSVTGCGYDSLNVLLSQEPLNPGVGADPNLGTVYLSTVTPQWYCDNGAGGTGTFRIDGRPDSNNCASPSGGWSVGTPGTSPYYIPAVQFHAVNSPSPSITSLSSAHVVAGVPFSFTVTTTGVPVPALNKIGGSLPKGLAFVDNGNGSATISGTALTRDRNKVYTVTVRARNGRNSVAKQRLLLTLTGGR
ncbi:MAG TPA: hypothetical protein VMU64_07360 [Acidimicrobiales bacterium]|nr:hypothetical protein [Acidimicrobiales bacterium]